MKKKQALTLYMTTWQKRMMKDFMPRSAFRGKSFRSINKMIIKPIVGRCPMSYKIPVDGIRRGDWVMYLTDEQMIMVGEYLGARTRISSINVAPEFIKAGDIAFR
jgi:hypothetical protein